MGYALAAAAADCGAEVVLVSGPTSLELERSSVSMIRVTSAEQMYRACMEQFPSCNAAIMSAAVADYTVRDYSGKKIKKKDDDLILHLEPAPDIAAELGKKKTGRQVLVGFALETDNELENARNKLEKKNFDFIIMNSLRDQGAGFGTDTNRITIVERDNNITEYGLKDKGDVARDIIDKLIEYVQMQ